MHTIFVALTTLLLWRLYRFTISPLIHSRDPKEYPYWIPFLGHLKSFFTNSCNSISKARLHFKDTREPFAFTVAGQTWYIITHPDDVATTYKINNDLISYDTFAVEVMSTIGLSTAGIDKAFRTSYRKGTKHTPCKSLVALCKEYQITQLSPGNRLDELTLPALEHISTRLNLKRLCGTKAVTMLAENGSATVLLYQLISQIFIGLGQEAYFGKALANIEPGLIPAFMEFDSVAWQVLYQYPKFLCGKMLKAKGTVHAALKTYFSLPIEERDDASWMILELEKDMKRLDIGSDDMALFFFQLYWSINGNIKKAPFWMLAYMLFRPSLLDTVRKEVKPAFSSSNLDTKYLYNSCPILHSVWEETLRLTAFAASARYLVQDVEIGSKILRKGNRIMIPQRQLHYNTVIFGENATGFEPYRFLNQPKLKRHSSFRPFGGGTTLCPGRHLTKQTSLAFVATMLHKFHIKLEPESQKFPMATEGNPSIGLVDVMQGSDITVKLSQR